MQSGISSHVFLQQRIHTGLLDAMQRAGAAVIEIFAARHHFDYTNQAEVRDIAAWFRDSGALATLHQPLYADAQWSRHVAPTLNLIDPEKSRRIDSMDEVKRAIESAEQIPFRSIVLHLGMKDDAAGPRSLENSLTAIEHLKAFADPLGVRLLIENLQNQVTAPEHLLEILRIGHFDSVGVCLDIGHAHLTDFHNPGAGIDTAFDLLKPRIAELHLHDNHGSRDEHLWPSIAGTGPLPNAANSIDWPKVYRHTSDLPPSTPAILEIAHDPPEIAESVQRKAAEVFSEQSRIGDRLARFGDCSQAEPQETRKERRTQ